MDGSKRNADEDVHHVLLELRSRKIPRRSPDGSKDRDFQIWGREENNWDIPEADGDETSDDSDESTDNSDATMDNPDATTDNPDVMSTEISDATMDNPDVMSTEISDATDDDEQPKKTRKPRRPNRIGTERIKVTRVNDAGEPVSPRKAAQTYGNAIGCTVREICNINESNLRAPEKSNVRDLLLNKLHKRFKFPKDDLKKVENHAMTKFTKALASWKHTARANFLHKGKDFADVQKQWPRISERDWALFKQNCNTEHYRKLSKWGKDLRSKNLGNHKLGSRGYIGKGPVWDKENAEFEKKGIASPWDQFKDPLEQSYVRARFKYDEKTGDFITDDKTKELMNELKNQYEEPQSSQGSSARWDCPLNRAINKTLGKSPSKRPTGGRVNGAGAGARWSCIYPESKEERKARRTALREKQMEDVRRLALEEYQAQSQAEAQQTAQDALHSMLPSVVEQIKAWVDNGKQGEFQLQPLVGSTSAAAPNASFENSLAVVPHHSSPCVTFMDAPASPKADQAGDYSIKRCISEMMTMALSTDEKAAAFDVFKDPDNREIFLSSKEDDPQAARVWLRKAVAKM